MGSFEQLTNNDELSKKRDASTYLFGNLAKVVDETDDLQKMRTMTRQRVLSTRYVPLSVPWDR